MKKILFMALFASSVFSRFAAADGFENHKGFVLEANLGFGAMKFSVDDGMGTTISDTKSALGVGFGIGGFITPQLAITLRAANVNYSMDFGDDGQGGTVTATAYAVFVGPSVQYWIHRNFWIGGGIGLAYQHLSLSDSSVMADSINDPKGVGFDLRAGYTFYKNAKNALNVSLEITPGFYSADDGQGGNTSYQLNGVTILFGYQYL
jgi:hypothetical protein